MTIGLNVERYKAALQLRRDGKKFREIGAALGVGVQRARTIVMQAERMEKIEASPPWTHGLSVRTANSLLSHGYSDREAVLSDIRAGRFNSGKNKISNIASKSVAEVYSWLNYDLRPQQTVPAAPNEWGVTEAFKTLERVTAGSSAAVGAMSFLRAHIERLSRPAHEREGPHCSTCDCGSRATP